MSTHLNQSSRVDWLVSRPHKCRQRGAADRWLLLDPVAFGTNNNCSASGWERVAVAVSSRRRCPPSGLARRRSLPCASCFAGGVTIHLYSDPPGISATAATAGRHTVAVEGFAADDWLVLSECAVWPCALLVYQQRSECGANGVVAIQFPASRFLEPFGGRAPGRACRCSPEGGTQSGTNWQERGEVLVTQAARTGEKCCGRSAGRWQWSTTNEQSDSQGGGGTWGQVPFPEGTRTTARISGCCPGQLQEHGEHGSTVANSRSS
mmetsp:Transcript_1943/g.4426  ORF Transcript_1943/g.4426 Transcript_1943/m.4426 type:complete len:264 (-) Transcript_1943:715-1506(-)